MFPRVPVPAEMRAKSSVYGLDVEPASIKPLPSYDDQNIFFKTVSGAAYVLKVHNIAKTGQSVSNLEAQNHAISTLVSAGINCPRVVAKTSLSDIAVDAASGSIDAADAAAVAEDTPATASAFCHVLPGGGRVCRVLQFVHGRMFVDVPDPKPLELFRALGRYLGQLDLALKVRLCTTIFCSVHAVTRLLIFTSAVTFSYLCRTFPILAPFRLRKCSGMASTRTSHRPSTRTYVPFARLLMDIFSRRPVGNAPCTHDYFVATLFLFFFFCTGD
jgi:hypothetical protein